MKTCKAPNCGNYVFSNLFCKYHQHLRTDKKWVKSLSKQRSLKKGYKIPPVSEKRSEELKTYSQLIKEIDTEARLNKQWNCFFCGGELKTDKPDHHHLKGREGKDLVDAAYIVLAHRKCHTEYHSKSVHDIKWFNEFVMRLTKISPHLAGRELMKLNK